MIFTATVKFHKRAYREAVLKQDHKNAKQLFISPGNIYKDMNGLVWKENNKEVVIAGQYHEVLSVIKNTDGYIVNIIEDKMENNLFRNFFDKSNASKKAAETLLFIFSLNFAMPQQESLLVLSVGCRIHAKPMLDAICNGFYFKATKPPQVG